MINTLISPSLSAADFAALTPDEMYDCLLKLGTENQTLRHQNEQLREMIVLMRHRQFGHKSERIISPQLPGFEHVFDEALVADEDQVEPAVAPQDYLKEKQKTGRKPLPDHLPRERIIHDLNKSAQQCGCGHLMHKIGEETSEQLEYIPAQVKVIQHVRYKYACKECENGVKTAPVPAQPIPKSMATANLLAHVVISKFDDHLPLYRQAEMWQRLGVDLNRSTLSNWVIKAGALCAPLVALLRDHILISPYVQADETTVTLLKQTKPRHKSYMWVYKTGYGKNISLVYDFQDSREGKHATAFLEGFTGYLQGDAYSGYNEVASRSGVTRVGCMAHARRKFIDVINMAPNKQGYAHQAVEKIKLLYQVEARIKEKDLPPDQVKLYREQHAKLLLDDLKKWLDELKPKALPKGSLGRAIAYALNHWSELSRYLEDGRLAIDNNSCEQAIKPFTVGRKNWLFVGNVRAANAAANLYSLIETAKANGIDSYHYLAHVLEMIPKLEAHQLQQLLPWNCPEYLRQTYKQAP